MKSKWLLVIGCLLLIINSCKKETNPSNSLIPQPEAITPPPAQTTTFAKFSVSNVFQDNMVIQRDKLLTIWGKVTTATKVTVNASWNNTVYTATADQNGDWSVAIPASAANATPQSITCKVDDANTVTLNNILIGDVWLCSGQSNMVMQVGAIAPFTGVLNYDQEIQAAQYPLIRCQTIASDSQSSAAGSFSGTNPWQVCSPVTVANMSAVAYFFARKIHTTLNVPVGIIVSAINGSYCSDWSANGSYYNSMISPLAKLSIKGFLWYQGENDQHVSPASSYTVMNNQLIQYWRTVFAQGALPFYLVQMTPFAEDYYTTDPVGGDQVTDYYAKFREAQANVTSTPGTGIAITMDVGELINHHPRNKKPVGERLALLALKNTYNQNVDCYGPKYLSFNQNNDKLTINYVAGTANGLNTINNAALNQYFFVAGTDNVLRNAPATINNNTVVLTIPVGTPLPIQSIRYAFTSAPITNLQNSAGLPAEPFRTDNW